MPKEFATMDFSETTNLTSMWGGMVKCTEFPDIYASNASYAVYMFSGVPIKRIPNIYIPNVLSISGMFASAITPANSCFELNKIVIGNKCTDASWFLGFNREEEEKRYNLVSSIISFFDTKYIRNYSYFIDNLYELEIICYFDTRRGTNFFHMFENSTKLQKLGPIDLRCATNIDYMLKGCDSLLDNSVELYNVPRTLDFSKISCSSSKYNIKNYIETALNPDDVRDDDPVQLS